MPDNASSRKGQLQPAEAWRRHAKGNSLYRNRGDGTFEETGAAEGVEMGRWAWSADGIDFDNDGTPEIFVTSGMLTNASETDLESFFWRKVAAASPASREARSPRTRTAGTRSTRRRTNSTARRAAQPNVFYVRRGGRYYDFSGVSGLDFAEDSRAFAVTDLDGDGNLDLLLKSRLGPQVRVFRNECGVGRKSLAIRLRGVQIESRRHRRASRSRWQGQVCAGRLGISLATHQGASLRVGRCRRRGVGTDCGGHPACTRNFATSLGGFVHQIEEGSEHVESAPFLPRREIAAGAIPTENRSQFTDTWLLEPVPLPEPFPGPGFLHLPETLSADRAAVYAIFVRYLFDLRADLKLPVWFLVDGESRAHKIYFSPPDQTDLKRMLDADRVAIALPFAGKYYSRPERNYSALGAAFFAGGYPDQALRYLERSPQDSEKILFAIGKIHLGEDRWGPARRSLEKGLALAPESADGWNSLGAVDVGEGNIAQALAHFEKALTFRPDMTSALVNAGQAHMALGSLPDAEKLFRRALEHRSEGCRRREPDGRTLRAGAKAMAKRAASFSRRSPRAATTRRRSTIWQRSMREPDNGTMPSRPFAMGSKWSPDEESFYLNLAGLYVSMDNRDAARAVIERLLARRPESPQALQALRELDRR